MLNIKKNIFVVSALSLFAICATLPACNSAQNKQEQVEKDREKVTDAKNELNKAQDDYQADLEKFRLDVDQRIANNETRIHELRDSITYVGKPSREERRKRIDELEQKNRDMKRRLNEYKADGNEKWQSFKREFNHDMDELGHALRDIGKNNVK